MVKQYTENQYDDDLTVGTDDYDDSYYTGSVDLFEFSNDEESPISRLKSLILSIDWEITDEVLMQFNEELLDLRDIWANEKINLIYVQALEKISKYIYQKKADSHPSAIKLLLTLYHNLEKIVSSYDLTEEQKKEILVEDVKRFESLKRHISQHTENVDKTQHKEPFPGIKTEEIDHKKDLLNLKAIVLGIDWEITDEDLNQLRQEVVRLEDKFADSRPKLILLQGIGTLGAYIKLKKSDAHADAFTILHLFYECLEKIVATPMRLEEEKAILFPAVEKFNSFKKLLGSTVAPGVISRTDKVVEEDESPADAVIAPAFADIPGEITGFQAEKEAKTLGLTASGSIDDHVESFFLGQDWQSPDEPVSRDEAAAANKINNPEVALQGVDVEADDEDDFDSGGPFASGVIAPALSSVIDDRPSPAIQEEILHEDVLQDEELLAFDESAQALTAEEEVESSLDFDFLDERQASTSPDFSTLDKNIVLQGVDVETEADDDSDEEALPLMEGELAPALVENDEVSIFHAEKLENSLENKIVDDEFAGTLEGFFDEEIESHLSAAPKTEDIISEIETDPEAEETLAFVEQAIQEESRSPLVDDSELEQVTQESPAYDVLVDDSPPARLVDDELNENYTEIDEQLDSFFDLDEDADQEADKTLLVPTLEETPEETFSPPVSEDIAEEEVIFELVEEVDQSFALQPDSGIIEQTPSDELSAADDSILASPLFAAEEAESVEELPQESGLPLEADVALGVYGPLRICVDSLGIELDDNVIQGLWREINSLRRNLSDKPLEKTFLQLLATITRHIDQNRSDSESDAYVLLQSVCGGLTALQHDDIQHNQEILLIETEKVLKWQEELLFEQMRNNEAELTIGGPIFTDQQDEYSNFDELLENYTEDSTAKSYGGDESNSTLAPRNIATDDLDSIDDDQRAVKESIGLEEEQGGTPEARDAKISSNVLKEEISTLRRNLQDEITELQKKLKGDYP